MRPQAVQSKMTTLERPAGHTRFASGALPLSPSITAPAYTPRTPGRALPEQDSYQDYAVEAPERALPEEREQRKGRVRRVARPDTSWREPLPQEEEQETLPRRRRRGHLRNRALEREKVIAADAAWHEEDVAEAAGQSAARSRYPACHYGLFVLTLLLTALSVPLVYSASTAIALDHHDRSDFFLWRQMGFAIGGVAVLVGSSRLSSARIRSLVWVLYAIALLGLVATDFTPLGLTLGGVRRWMKMGPIPLQFSELAKIALAGVLADFWSRTSPEARRTLRPWVGAFGLTLPVVLLVFVQPHLSAASLLFLLPFCMAFYAAAPLRQMLKIALPLVLAVGVVIVGCKTHHMPLLKTYQQDRIASHFSSGDGKDGDARGGNYQALQGQRALIRGGMFGTGPGGSLFKQGHLPAPHTDFILAIIGEEWGLVGMLLLLIMYGAMIFFCFHVGHCSGEPFPSLLCAGMGTLLAIQMMCNAGVVTGLMPVTGMPLPLLSYGGSGLLCSLLGIGLVLGVSRHADEEQD